MPPRSAARSRSSSTSASRSTRRAAARPQARTAAERLLSRGLSRRDAAAALHVCLGMPRREAEALVREVAAEG